MIKLFLHFGTGAFFSRSPVVQLWPSTIAPYSLGYYLLLSVLCPMMKRVSNPTFLHNVILTYRCICPWMCLLARVPTARLALLRYLVKCSTEEHRHHHGPRESGYNAREAVACSAGADVQHGARSGYRRVWIVRGRRKVRIGSSLGVRI